MLWQVLVAASLLAGLSVFAIVSRRTIPYVTVGWFWFLGTLVPVIGIVQVGMQDHADRYMYVPMVGLLLIAAWGGADLVKAWPAAQPAIAALAVVCCAASMFASRKEVAYWRNSESLFGRALEVTQDNWVAHFALGNYLARTGHVAAALPHFEEAVRIVPDYPDGHNDLGAALMQLGDCEAAGVQFRLALQKEPNRADANYNLGQCQAATGNDAAAIRYYEAAIKARPGYLDAMVGLGRSLSRFPSHAADAIACYDVALRLAPDDPRVHADLGKLLAKLGRKEEAIEHLEAAERLRPDPEVRKILDGLR
jgi:tetratricopeptide (TPR) repeat protein